MKRRHAAADSCCHARLCRLRKRRDDASATTPRPPALESSPAPSASAADRRCPPAQSLSISIRPISAPTSPTRTGR